MEMRISLYDVLKNAMEGRYKLYQRDSFNGTNTVFDAYLPYYTITGNGNIPLTAKAITHNTAKQMNIDLIPMEDLATMVGYTKKDLTKLFIAVKKKNINLYLLGAGGTGSSFIYWSERILEMIGQANIVNSVIIHDMDTWDITNLVRVPFDLSADEVDEHFSSADKAQTIENKVRRMTGAKSNVSKAKFGAMAIDIIKQKEKSINMRIVVYGAPDIETREMIYDYNQNNDDKLEFVSATHGAYNYTLASVPEQNSGLQLEAYGLIDLNMFHMNQLIMTLKFYEAVAAGYVFNTTADITEGSFLDMLEDTQPRSKTSRTYNFTTEPRDEQINTEATDNAVIEPDVPEEDQQAVEVTLAEPTPEGETDVA